MCGLTGSLEFEPATPAETLGRQTRAMADTLVHRGPDSDGQWIDAKAGIAFGCGDGWMAWIRICSGCRARC